MARRMSDLKHLRDAFVARCLRELEGSAPISPGVLKVVQEYLAANPMKDEEDLLAALKARMSNTSLPYNDPDAQSIST